MSGVFEARGGDEGMMVIIANGGAPVRRLHALHPGKIGWLIGPSSFEKPRDETPFVLDNDAFGAWKRRELWNELAWMKMLEKVKQSEFNPLWCLVPDVVANKEKTIENWSRYGHVVKECGWKAAFAVQDGMVVSDVPCDADVIFVGGTTGWKWRTAPMWTDEFPRVHIGRVREGKLLTSFRLGAESIDGSGWLRESEDGKPARYLKAWLEGSIQEHPDFFLTAN